jgi:hypothetical protein
LVDGGSRPQFAGPAAGQQKEGKMANTKLGRRLLISGLLVVSGMSTREAPAQAVVFLNCIFYNGRVDRIKIDPSVNKAYFRNGGTFTLEVSESVYTLTAKIDLGTGSGGVVDLETKIDRRTEQLTSRIIGVERQLLGGMCSGDQPW